MILLFSQIVIDIEMGLLLFHLMTLSHVYFPFRLFAFYYSFVASKPTLDMPLSRIFRAELTDTIIFGFHEYSILPARLRGEHYFFTFSTEAFEYEFICLSSISAQRLPAIAAAFGILLY